MTPDRNVTVVHWMFLAYALALVGFCALVVMAL